MYKVREQRLKEFYTSGEVARDIQTTSNITTKTSSSKHAENTHHADSLLDHSFQSLKSKEIRDSESPTKDLAFSRSAVHSDRGWNVQETQESSRDGKTQSVSKLATTSGSKEIQGGVSHYAAKNEAKATVYQDGDDKNFKKAVGTSNSSVLKQEAHGVDGDTSFKSTSTSSSTSSRYVSEQKSSSTQGYVPDAVLKDPNTKVFTETKILPDGTRVTKTRYETTGACTKTSGTQNSSNTVVKSSSTSSQRRESQQRESKQREIQQREITQDTKQLQQSAHNVREETRQQLQETNQNIQNVQNVQHVQNVQNVHKEHREHHENIENVQRSSVNVHREQREERRVQESEKCSREQHDRHDKIRTIEDKSVKDTSIPKMENVQTITTTTTTTTNKNVGKPTEQIIDSRRSSQTVVERDSSVNVINTNKTEKVHTEKQSTNTAIHSTSFTQDKQRVSVDISPTHDAFARSLRSVTPDRDRRTQSFRHPSLDKKTRITSEKRGSQQYGSNETITKSVHTEYDRRSSSPREKPITEKPTDKVLRRTDTYEERVRQILGITEKKKPKPDKDVSDIIANDRHANRKPSWPDVVRRPSKSPEKKVLEYPAQKRTSVSYPERKPSLKSPEKDIAPQTNWLPSAPRQTPERKTPDRVTFSPDKGTATAKEIRKYHGGKRTCSPAIDLEIVTDRIDAKKKSMSPCRDDMIPRAFTTAKNGQTYTVDFINVEKEISVQQRASPERSSPSRTTPRASPQRETSPKKTTDSLLKEETKQKQSSETYKTVQTTEDELMKSNVKHLKGKQIDEVDEPLFTKKFMYKLGKDEEEPAVDRRSKSQSPRRLVEEDIITEEIETIKHKTVKKDLSFDEQKEKKRKQKTTDTTTTTATVTTGKKTPTKKNSATNLVTQTINLETSPKTTGNKTSKPKSRPEETPKCISTKSIIINEAVAEQREIIVDLKRSKSSREDSPEKVWPVQTEEDSGIPRYPDQIQEPEDSRRNASRKTKVNDIIIDEDERIEEFNRITELVDTEITDVDRVAETDECLLTVNEKVNKFQHTKNTSKKSKGPAPKVSRPEFNVDETLRSDDCLLSVSDKVHKFKTTADQLKADSIPERPKSPRCQFTTTSKTTTSEDVRQERRQSSEVLKDDECLLSVSEKVIKFVDTAETLKKKPEVALSDLSPKPKKKPVTAPILDDTPKSSKKVYLSSVGKLRSSESIKKAKVLFETAAESTKNTSSISKLRSTKEIQQDKSHLDDVRRTITYEDENVPGYMKQLDRSLRITSPHRESVLELEEISKGHVTTQLHEDIHLTDQEHKTKFGVTLRRTDSEKKNVVERKESTTIEVNGAKKEIEDVYDLTILETMLETVTNYELRRRIRGQIRIVKKMISEEKITTSMPRRRSSAEKNVSVTENYKVTKKITTTRDGDKVDENILKRPSVIRKDKSPEKMGFKPFRRSPERQTKKDDRPDWAKERPLRKASERVVPTTKRFISTTTVRKEVKKERSPSKDATDAITSCYGIGPTDENGMPLFGLKALRAHNKTKVQGQVTKSSFYSENGKEPVGEITVTKYSGDPTHGIQSKTTTQKIGTKKAVSSIGRSVDKKVDERTKVTRRNSVKEITQKFIDNNSKFFVQVIL